MYSTVVALILSEFGCFFIASLLDEGRLSFWVTVFKFSVFVAEVPVRSGNGTEGMSLSIWCARAF